jgi:hypothetical protein
LCPRRVDLTYDGEGHRTAISVDDGTNPPLVTTFRYQGSAIVAEDLDGDLIREYVTDDTGTISKVVIPPGEAEAGTYLVTWNGHGDAMALWRIETNGSLTLANSYTYSTWGSPTTATHNGIADLGFRFLYVGAHDVQYVTLTSGRRITDYQFFDLAKQNVYSMCSICNGYTRTIRSNEQVREIRLTIGVYFTSDGYEESLVPALATFRIVFRNPPALAIAPGITIRPCSMASLSREQLLAAGREVEDRVAAGDLTWVPHDAVLLEGGIPGARVGAVSPATYVISSAGPPRMLEGQVSPDGLPPCGGHPRMQP